MPERIENRMVVDSEWRFLTPPEAAGEAAKEAGYLEMGTGKFIPEDEAFDYAIEKLSGSSAEEKQEFISYFYSGNYIYQEG